MHQAKGIITFMSIVIGFSIYLLELIAVPFASRVCKPMGSHVAGQAPEWCQGSCVVGRLYVWLCLPHTIRCSPRLYILFVKTYTPEIIAVVGTSMGDKTKPSME